MTNWIDELEKAAEKATPGPYNLVQYDGLTPTCRDGIFPMTEEDAVFIYRANPDTVLKLCKIARAAKEFSVAYHTKGEDQPWVRLEIENRLEEALRDDRP